MIEVTYRGAASALLSDEYRLDFAEIEGTMRLGSPPLHSIARALEALQGDVRRIATGLQRLKIDVFNSQDRADESVRIRTINEEGNTGTNDHHPVSKIDT